MILEFPQVLLLWTALFLLIFWLPALFTPNKFLKVLDKLMKNEDLMRTRWIIALFFGLAYLTVYQAIDATWGVLFSLLGYASLIKGIVLIWYPGFAKTKFEWLYNTAGKVIAMGIVILIVALLCTWAALSKI